jgi:hypothetical protein
MKFYGRIGINKSTPREDNPYIYKHDITEVEVYGDILKYSNRFENNGGSVIDKVVLSNTFSIIADPKLTEQMSNFVYLDWNGQKWEITQCNVSGIPPRIEMHVGGAWNGTE